MSDRLSVDQLGTPAKELNPDEGPRIYHLGEWAQMTHPQRLVIIRQIAEMRGRDHRIAKMAADIIRSSRARPREYEKQAAALLRWVQNPKNVYYLNEGGERLQDPIYTLSAKHGDCDCMVLLLCSFFESIRLSWRLCLSGKNRLTGRKIRHIEGQPVPENVAWAHIYCVVATPPFEPKKWFYCEPTIQGVPLGWDTVSGSKSYLPKYIKRYSGPVVVARSPKAPVGYRPPPVDPSNPAYELAMGGYGAETAVADQFIPSDAAMQTAADQAVQVATTATKDMNFLVRKIEDKFQNEGGWEGFKQRVMFNVATGIPAAIIVGLLSEAFLIPMLRGLGLARPERRV